MTLPPVPHGFTSSPKVRPFQWIVALVLPVRRLDQDHVAQLSKQLTRALGRTGRRIMYGTNKVGSGSSKPLRTS